VSFTRRIPRIAITRRGSHQASISARRRRQECGSAACRRDILSTIGYIPCTRRGRCLPWWLIKTLLSGLANERKRERELLPIGSLSVVFCSCHGGVDACRTGVKLMERVWLRNDRRPRIDTKQSFDDWNPDQTLKLWIVFPVARCRLDRENSDFRNRCLEETDRRMLRRLVERSKPR